MASLFQIRRGASGSLDNGELYYNTTSQSLQLGNNTNTDVITLAKLNETNSGSLDISGSLNLGGNLIVSGNTKIVGNLTFGDQTTDTITVVADFGSNLIPSQSNEYNLGTTTKYWKNAFIAYITGSLSGSVDGINVTNFSTSVDSRLDYIETTFSTSVDSRLDQVESTASVLVNTFSASQYKNDSSSFDSRLDYFETTFSTSVDLRLDEVEASASYLYTTFSSSVDLRLDEVESTASFLVNTFSASQYNNDSSSFDSRLIATEETGSNHESRIDILETSQSAFDTAVVLDSTNVTILGNLTVQGTQTSLNTTEVFVEDLSLTLASGSLTSTDANGAGIQIAGANVTMSWNHTNQRIELNKDFAVTGSISSSTITGIGNVTDYSTSVNSRLGQLESTGSNFDGRLDSIETYTGSVSTSVGLLQTFSSSQYINDSSSFDSRLDLTEATASYLNTTFSTSVDSRLDALETDSGSQESRIVALELTSQSLNEYTASVSTSVGLLQTFSASQYINDSSSFSTRISASTLTFNDTTGQSAIDFTQVGTQVSAIASGLTTGSNVQFNNITSSGFISASGTITCDTLVATTFVGATLPVLEYETNGTLGNILIKGATSKSIQVVDSITFTGLQQNGLDQYSATGLQLTGSLHVTQDITASGNLFVSGTIYTYELHSVIQSSSVIFSSGSTKIGDEQSDVLTITGSLYQTGSTSFSELTGSLFAFSSSLNSRIGTIDVTTLSASIYQTDATQSNNITINSASAWGAFQSASLYSASLATSISASNATATSYSASLVTSISASNAAATSYSASSYTRDANQDTNITSTSASAWGAFQSASSYSASADTTYAKVGVENTFTTNQIISGSLNVTGDVVAYSTSDERLKDNIQLISNPIQKVQELRGVEFDWNDKSIFKAGKHDYGVIAQDVEKVLPELVKESSTGYLGVDYDKIIGLLIEVVKEQEKRIKNLENK